MYYLQLDYLQLQLIASAASCNHARALGSGKEGLCGLTKGGTEFMKQGAWWQPQRAAHLGMTPSALRALRTSIIVAPVCSMGGKVVLGSEWGIDESGRG